MSFPTIEKVVDSLQAAFQASGEKEISSVQIGERVMAELLKLDDVAYVRFASVYRQFKDISQFVEEIKVLISEPPEKGKP